jgi:hypothetical protein
VTDEDRELEDRLRALPTAGPPAALRERILTTAARGPRQSAWRLRLALALGLLGLLALDVGVQQVQSARISRLIGGGSSSVAAGPNDLAAVMQQRAMIARLLRNGEIRDD